MPFADRRFAYDHLKPGELQGVSRMFRDLAHDISEMDIDEATMDKALDKLFEAKNLVVLAMARPA